MPKDIRRLVFNNDEVTEALKSYGNSEGVTVPDGRVVKLTLTEKDIETASAASKKHTAFLENFNIGTPKQSAIVTYFNPHNQESKNQYLPTTTEFVTAALIHYCLEHPDIKIPKQGQKSVAKTEFDICLDIFYDVTSGQEPEPDFEFED